MCEGSAARCSEAGAWPAHGAGETGTKSFSMRESPAPNTGGVPRRRAVVAIAVAAVAVDAALLGLIAPLLPAIEQRTGAGEGALGLALAAYAIPIALLSLPLGRAADLVGRRALLVAGLALVAAGSGLIAASESLGVLIAARAVQGVGSAASWISALALVSDAAPADKRGQWLGVALGATGVGSIAGPALGGVAADVLSFEAPFLIFAALAMALLVAAIGLVPREPPRTRPAAPAPAAIIRSTRSGHGAWGSGIILASAFVLGLIEVVAPLDLDARLGLSSAAIGLLFAGSIVVEAGACAGRRPLGRSPRAARAPRWSGWP
jgi:MFS family permease